MYGCGKDLVMPTYSYKCVSCSKIEDVVHGINDEYTDICSCGGKMQKVFYPAGVSFKGSGFYSTDSKGK
jgi:putative FmdB family regulatory protein